MITYIYNASSLEALICELESLMDHEPNPKIRLTFINESTGEESIEDFRVERYRIYNFFYNETVSRKEYLDALYNIEVIVRKYITPGESADDYIKEYDFGENILVPLRVLLYNLQKILDRNT